MPPLMFTHYQFLTWPGTEAIPFNPMAFVQFVQHIRKCHPLDVSDAPPLLVHCSSGVGRTGVFIAVDQLLGLVAKGKGLNVFTCVRSLRQQRMKMVETQVRMGGEGGWWDIFSQQVHLSSRKLPIMLFSSYNFCQ